MRQAEVLLGPEWLGNDRLNGHPTILLGDFNSIPSSPPYRRLAGALTDVRTHMAGQLRPTFPSRFPLLRLDHIFVSKDVAVVEAEVISTPLAKLASDHLPLVATIEI